MKKKGTAAFIRLLVSFAFEPPKKEKEKKKKTPVNICDFWPRSRIFFWNSLRCYLSLARFGFIASSIPAWGSDPEVWFLRDAFVLLGIRFFFPSFQLGSVLPIRAVPYFSLLFRPGFMLRFHGNKVLIQLIDLSLPPGPWTFGPFSSNFSSTYRFHWRLDTASVRVELMC